MKKIPLLTTEVTPKKLDKLIYLDRLLNLYVQFLKTWRNVEVACDGETVSIKFFRIDKYGYYSFTERTFSLDSLDNKITSYKKKFNDEYIIRNSNQRVLRERNIRKWKKYIQDAESEMHQ